MGEVNKVESALEAVAKKLAEMEGRLLDQDKAKAILDKAAEQEAKAKEEDVVAKKAEELIRAKAERDPAMVDGRAKAAAKGKHYNFLHARRDVAKGKNLPVPYWDDETFELFNEYMCAVHEKDSARLRKVYEKANAPYTVTTTAGGYLVPDIFLPELIRAQYVKSLMLQKCRIIPMPSDQVYLPTVSAGITAVWGTINTATGDTKATLGQVSLATEKLVAVSYVPNELMQDSMIGMGSFIADEFTDAFAKKIDDEALEGDATDTAHKFDGWSDAATTNRAGSGTSGDSANGSLQADHLLDTIGKLDELEIVGAEWFMHPTSWAYIRGLADTNSDLLVGIDKDYRYNLYGFPVNLTSRVTTKASVGNGDVLCWFGNPKNYIIGTRSDINVRSSEHVAITADQTVFVGTQRLAMAVGLEGALAVLVRMGTDGGYDPV